MNVSKYLFNILHAPAWWLRVPARWLRVPAWQLRVPAWRLHVPAWRLRVPAWQFCVYLRGNCMYLRVPVWLLHGVACACMVVRTWMRLHALCNYVGSTWANTVC